MHRFVHVSHYAAVSYFIVKPCYLQVMDTLHAVMQVANKLMLASVAQMS